MKIIIRTTFLFMYLYNTVGGDQRAQQVHITYTLVKFS